MFGVPALMLAVAAWWWLTSGRTESTDNASVDAPVSTIAPLVGGPIVEVAVRENQLVKQGDLLFRIDPAPYRIALHQADAALSAARVQLSEQSSAATASDAQIGVQTANIGAREADVALARQNFERQAALMRQGFTTRANYDDARAQLAAAEQARAAAVAGRAGAAASAQAAHAALGTGAGGVQPAVAAARAQREKALLDLARTEVRAPRSGRVAQADRLQVGNMATLSLPLLSIVDASDVWISANFKETQLGKIRVGQPATIEIDALKGRAFTGRVASIGAGTGAEFSLLPAQNASGNWVKVTQRVPVRIHFDGPPPAGLVAGWSAKVVVRVAD